MCAAEFAREDQLRTSAEYSEKHGLTSVDGTSRGRRMAGEKEKSVGEEFGERRHANRGLLSIAPNDAAQATVGHPSQSAVTIDGTDSGGRSVPAIIRGSPARVHRGGGARLPRRWLRE